MEFIELHVGRGSEPVCDPSTDYLRCPVFNRRVGCLEVAARRRYNTCCYSAVWVSFNCYYYTFFGTDCPADIAIAAIQV